MPAERKISTGQRPLPVRSNRNQSLTSNVIENIQNPLPNSLAEQYIWGCDGLTYGERAIIGAVLRNMPRPTPDYPISTPSTTQIVARIVRLSINKLKLLADLFYAALTEAREWAIKYPQNGSQTAGASPASAGESPVDRYRPLFAALGIAMVPNVVGHLAPVRGADRIKSTLERHIHSCPITEAETGLELTQVLPFSLSSLHSDGESPFWMFLGICLGPAARDLVFDLVDNDEAKQSTLNCFLLRADLKIMYDQGLFYLAPLIHKFSASTCRVYDVRLYWFGTQRQLSTLLIPVHPEPVDQVTVVSANFETHEEVLDRVRGGPPRKIENGDQFRFFTNDPVKNPLPNPVLFRLHGMLSRMLAASRIDEYHETPSKRRYSEVSDGDEDDEGSSKRGTNEEFRGYRTDRTSGESTEQESGEASRSGWRGGQRNRNGNSNKDARAQENVSTDGKASRTSSTKTPVTSGSRSNKSTQTIRTRSMTPPGSRKVTQAMAEGDIVFGAEGPTYLDRQLHHLKPFPNYKLSFLEGEIKVERCDESEN